MQAYDKLLCIDMPLCSSSSQTMHALHHLAATRTKLYVPVQMSPMESGLLR